MTMISRAWLPWMLLPLLVITAVLIGCGAAPGTVSGTSGGGADAGPWPSPPNRDVTNAARPSPDQTPDAPLAVVLRAKTAEGEELQLDLLSVEIKSDDQRWSQWVPVVGRADIAKNEGLPMRLGEKHSAALLTRTRIPRREYSHLRLQFGDARTALVKGETSLPLAIQSSALELKGWKLDEGKTNVLTIELDGTKVSRAERSATLPASAVSTQTGVPSGGISGKITPPMPTGRVDVYWGGGTVLLGSDVPNAQTGAFAIANLPAGSYRVEIRTPGYRLIDPLKDAVAVSDKITALPDLQLAPENPAQ